MRITESPTPTEHEPDVPGESLAHIFLIFLRLGLTSFGGPIAHLGYFRDEFVTRRRWLSERGYAELVALCQFLPGPASSQVGMALGLFKRGYPGALVAWAGFTLPSATAMILIASGIADHASMYTSGVLHGLKVVAVAIVMQAVWGMARNLCTDAPRIAIMLVATCAALLFPSALTQIAILVVAALCGLFLSRRINLEQHESLPISVGHRAGSWWLILFFLLLIGLPLLTTLIPNHALASLAAFYRAGALVFGGGHVVLPLLQMSVVTPGWISNETFLAGYAAAQAVPGPLFTFAAFLGASMTAAPSGWSGGILCLLAIFAPSFLLIAGVLPFWEQVRRNSSAQAALAGINAAVVGLLLAALYDPVWTSAIHRPADFVLAMLAFAALMVWKLPPWLVIAGGSIAGLLLNMML